MKSVPCRWLHLPESAGVHGPRAPAEERRSFRGGSTPTSPCSLPEPRWQGPGKNDSFAGPVTVATCTVLMWGRGQARGGKGMDAKGRREQAGRKEESKRRNWHAALSYSRHYSILARTMAEPSVFGQPVASPERAQSSHRLRQFR